MLVLLAPSAFGKKNTTAAAKATKQQTTEWRLPLLVPLQNAAVVTVQKKDAGLETTFDDLRNLSTDVGWRQGDKNTTIAEKGLRKSGQKEDMEKLTTVTTTGSPQSTQTSGSTISEKEGMMTTLPATHDTYA